MGRRILIIEDQREIVTSLVEIIKTYAPDANICTSFSEEEAYGAAIKSAVDLFLVDIVLDSRCQNDVSGIIFVEHIREIPKYKFTPVIFITCLEDHQLQAFHRLHCYGYVEKPFDEEKLGSLIRDALLFPKTAESDKDTFHYRKDGVIYWLDLSEIMYVASNNRKLIIHTIDDRIILPHRSCRDILDEFPAGQFLQCRRDTIVNRDFIRCYDNTNAYIVLKDDTRLEVGRRYAAELRCAMI